MFSNLRRRINEFFSTVRGRKSVARSSATSMADTTTAYDTLPGLACREMVELITSYLEGRLPPEDNYRFERHLEVCPNCTEYLKQMRLTIAAAGRVSTEDLSAQERDELLELFRDWRKAS